MMRDHAALAYLFVAATAAAERGEPQVFLPRNILPAAARASGQAAPITTIRTPAGTVRVA